MPHSTSMKSVQRQLPKQGYKVLARSRFTHVNYILIIKVPPQLLYRICTCSSSGGKYQKTPSLQRIIRRKPVMIHCRATIMAGSLLSSWLDIRLQPSTAAETFCLVRKMTLLLLCLSTTALIPHSLLNAETQLACCEGAQLGDDTGYGCWLRCRSSGHNETIITSTTNFSGCDSIEINLVEIYF